MLKKLVSHSLIYGIGPFIPKILGFFMLPIFTSVLTEIDYGVQSTINSGLGLIGALGMLGLQLPLTNSFFHHRHHYKTRWAQLYGFLNIWMVIYSFLLVVLIYWITPTEAKENQVWIIILNIVPIVFFGPTALIGQTYYQLNQKPLPIVIRTIIIAFTTLALNYYTIVILNLHYMGWFISNCISSLILNFSYWYVLRFKLEIKPYYFFKKYVIKNSLKISLPMLPHYYATFILGSADILILKIFTIATSSIGFYGFAAGFGGIASMAVGAMTTAAGPILMELISKKQYDKVKYLTWISLVILISSTTIICLFLREIFGFLVRNEVLKGSYYLAAVFVLAHNYRPILYGSTSFLFYNEKTANLWKITFGASLFFVIVNFVLIPILGFEVPAYVLFIAYLISGYGIFFLKDFKKVNKVDFKPHILILLNIFSLILVLYLINCSLYLKIIVTFCIIVIVLIFLIKSRKNGI